MESKIKITEKDLAFYEMNMCVALHNAHRYEGTPKEQGARDWLEFCKAVYLSAIEDVYHS